MIGGHRKRNRWIRVILGLVLAGALVYLGLIGMVCWKEKHVAEVEDPGAIIVLGCQVKKDGTPNLQLQWRLDAAYEVWQKHRCPIVVTGGQGADEPIPEGQAMRTYLLGRGVPAEDILVDDTSSNTRQNLREAMRLLGGGTDRPVVIVTSDYHLPRAIAMAADEGIQAGGRASETLGGIHWIKNHCREALAWVKYWIEKYAGITL